MGMEGISDHLWGLVAKYLRNEANAVELHVVSELLKSDIELCAEVSRLKFRFDKHTFENEAFNSEIALQKLNDRLKNEGFLKLKLPIITE